MKITACYFPGAGSLPILAAAERGMFDDAGLDVELVPTRSSTDLMQGLIDGDFQVVHAAPDNFVAWADRTGADIVAWVGGTSGPLALVAAPEITEIEQLRGRSIAVDSPTSGFSAVLQTILRAAGFGPDDYELDDVGATHLRYRALLDGKAVATLLSLPLTLQAPGEGLNVLTDHTAVIPRFQGGAGGSLRAWLMQHPATADAYLRGIRGALTWLYAPDEPEDVIDYTAATFETDHAQARELCTVILDPVHGWPPSGFIDPVGMEIMCELRSRTIERPAKEPAAYMANKPTKREQGKRSDNKQKIAHRVSMGLRREIEKRRARVSAYNSILPCRSAVVGEFD